MDKNASIIQEYYKVEGYWRSIADKDFWKLAIWVAHYPDIEVISQYMNIESTVLGETKDIFLQFNAVFEEDESYERDLWNEFISWFNPANEEKYDMHKALIKDHYLLEPFVPNTSLSPTIENLISELERFRKAIRTVSISFVIEFSLANHQKAFNLWLNKLLHIDTPKEMRFVTIDIAEKRICKDFDNDVKDKVVELYPKLNMVNAIKDDMAKMAAGNAPHNLDAKYRLTVMELLEALPDKKKVGKIIPSLLQQAKLFGENSLLVSTHLIISNAYYSLSMTKEGLLQVEEALKLIETLNDEQQKYPLWRSAMLYKAAFLMRDEKEELSFEVYKSIAKEATAQKDYFYIMEGYRLCASIKMHQKDYPMAFEYASLALYGGQYLDLETRRNSTYLYVANIAYNTLKYVPKPDVKRPILYEFLSDTLGRDWEDIISSGENLHRHYAPLPEEEELTDIPLESTEG